MIFIETFTDFLLLMMYPLEALFLVFMSKKCFFDRFPVWKAALILLFSPPAANFIAFFATDLQFDPNDGIVYAGVNALLLFSIHLIFMFIYLKIVHAKNASIAVFLYLSSSMLVPSVVMALGFGYKHAYIIMACVVMLNIAFYFLVGVRIIELSKEKQDTNLRTFVTLSITVFIYKVFVLYIQLRMSSTGEQIALGALDVAKTLKATDINVHSSFKSIFDRYLEYSGTSGMLAFISEFFILAVLIGAFHVITRNMMYTNEVVKAHDETKRLAVEMMEALAHTIDAKDKYTKGHSVRVANYSRMLASRMGLSDKECEDVYYYGLLHDLGKIGVPNSIINSDTKLTDEQFKVIQKHPQIGFDILSEIQSRPDLTIGARWHHERYDGKGYPDGKKGEEIPLLARIIAVADSYDAMTSNRSYRQYLPQDVVREEIIKNSGIQFDPKIAQCMVDIINEDKEYNLHE